VATDIPDAIRAAVARRANRCCEYCLIREEDTGFPHQVDHIVSRKHGGTSRLENLALACVPCNRHKGTDVASIAPQTGMIVRLFHPRLDRWEDHFRLNGEIVAPLSEVGAATIRLLKLNSAERLAERRLLQRLDRYPL
jgi:hypothetical protein